MIFLVVPTSHLWLHILSGVIILCCAQWCFWLLFICSGGTCYDACSDIIASVGAFAFHLLVECLAFLVAV